MAKEDIKLTKVIGIWLLVIASLLVVVTGALVISFDRLTVGRADDTEKQVEAWLENFDGSAPGFSADLSADGALAGFPEGADYVVEFGGSVAGSRISGCTDEEMDRGIGILKSSGLSSYPVGQEVFLARAFGDGTIYIHYSMKVRGEWLVLAVFIVLYIAAILVPSVLLIHRLRKTIYALAEEKWRREYGIRQEMAQMAHDLKTPLTVIRGNADLLLEKDLDEESLESVNAIIGNSERIAKSVVEILEKG